MFAFATDYLILIFVASIGVIQIAASVGGLRGLLIFKSPLLSLGSGLTLAIAAFVWFFSTTNRNINDYNGGLDGNTQALLFFLGSLAGVVATFLGSSIINLKMVSEKPSPKAGLDALRDTSYLKALSHSFRYWSSEWRT